MGSLRWRSIIGSDDEYGAQRSWPKWENPARSAFNHAIMVDQSDGTSSAGEKRKQIAAHNLRIQVG
jgi:hypothetical protein